MQIEKQNKMRQKKRADFEHNLTNMLIHLYNGKQCNEYIKEYKHILEIVRLNIFLIPFS
jgi:hypothetical protein